MKRNLLIGSHVAPERSRGRASRFPLLLLLLLWSTLPALSYSATMQKASEQGMLSVTSSVPGEDVDVSRLPALAYKVFAEDGGEVATGEVDGPPVELPEGDYRIEVLLDPVFKLIVPIHSGRTTEIGVTRKHPDLRANLCTANVAEAGAYDLVYLLEVPTNSDYNDAPVPYAIDNAAKIDQYSRVAYCLELDDNWVWVSMRDFTDGDITHTGVPVASVNPEGFQQKVSEMHVHTNVDGIADDDHIATGNVEFWHNCYNPERTLGLPGTSDQQFDADDILNNVSCDGWGSMQVHNHGKEQTILSYSGWDTPEADSLGIGNQPSDHPDWTFSKSAGAYTTRNLWVYVKPGAPKEIRPPERTEGRHMGIVIRSTDEVSPDELTNVRYGRFRATEEQAEMGLDPGRPYNLFFLLADDPGLPPVVIAWPFDPSGPEASWQGEEPVGIMDMDLRSFIMPGEPVRISTRTENGASLVELEIEHDSGDITIFVFEMYDR